MVRDVCSAIIAGIRNCEEPVSGVFHGKNGDGSPAVETFSATPEQAAKMVDTWRAPELIATHRMSKGDADAIRDVANEAAKRKARGE